MQEWKDSWQGFFFRVFVTSYEETANLSTSNSMAGEIWITERQWEFSDQTEAQVLQWPDERPALLILRELRLEGAVWGFLGEGEG